MNETLTLGKINTLAIDRLTAPGAFLKASDGAEVLLPKKYVRKGAKVGDELEVFVMNDSEDRLVAVTDKPLAMADEFGFFEVVESANFGAFVNWGLPKDLFVPKKNQKTPFIKGDKRILRVIKDGDTNRLIGDERIVRYLSKDVSSLAPKQCVELLVLAETPLGYKVIADNAFEGMIYHEQIFEGVSVGERKKGYIKKLREDGKLDISLQPIGEERKDSASKKVLEILRKNDGYMRFTYKSSPEEIMLVFGLSRKNFKFALTKLLEEKAIALDDKGITLL